MQKTFTYSDLKPIYDAEPSHAIGIYMWLHEYCDQYLKNHPELKKVTLKMEGEDVGKLEGRIYEFKREKPEDVKLRVNRD